METHISHQHLTFVKEVIRHGDKEKAYGRAYPNARSQSCKSSASRLYSRPEIKQLIDEGRAKAMEKAMEIVMQEATETMADELLSLHEKRRELARIVRRQQRMKRYYKFKDHIEEKEVPVDNPNVILRAIALDAKLEAASQKMQTETPAKKKDTGAPSKDCQGIRFYIDGKALFPDYPDLTDEEHQNLYKRALTDDSVVIVPPRLFGAEQGAGCWIERDLETGKYRKVCPEETKEYLQQHEFADIEQITFVNKDTPQPPNIQIIEGKSLYRNTPNNYQKIP